MKLTSDKVRQLEVDLMFSFTYRMRLPFKNALKEVKIFSRGDEHIIQLTLAEGEYEYEHLRRFMLQALPSDTTSAAISKFEEMFF